MCPYQQRSHDKQRRTATAGMSPFCPPHLILVGSTMSHIQCLRHIYHTEKGRSRWEAQHGGEAFWVQDDTCSCALLAVPSTSWTILAKQKDCMNSCCHKGELGLHYLVELTMKRSISAHPKAPEQSTNQSLANCLLLRSKNLSCAFVTSFVDWWEEDPEGRENIFQERSF